MKAGSLQSLWTSYSPIVNFSDRAETLAGFLDKFLQSLKVQIQEVETEQKHAFGEIVPSLLTQMISGVRGPKFPQGKVYGPSSSYHRDPGGRLAHCTRQLELSSQEDYLMYLICPGASLGCTVC